MKKIIPFFLFVIISFTVSAQSFEGKIVYKTSYKSKSASVTDAQFNQMLGSVQEYYIKGSNYKSVLNGSLAQWQLYIPSDNKLYNKMSNSEVVLWNDGAVNTDSVLKAEINRGVTEILGYTCDELILHCKSGVQKYYFSSRIPVDAKLFINHKYGNWYEFVSRSNALPLKTIIESPQIIAESVATEIKPGKLDASFFALPANVQMQKNPY